MSDSTVQDKRKERSFFDQHAAAGGEYDVFDQNSSEAIVARCADLARLDGSCRILDIGCGSGVFTTLLAERVADCIGLDLSVGLLRVARRRFPSLAVVGADGEHLPFSDCQFDAVVLSGVVHHLPDPSAMAIEVHRVLRPGGRFVAFDPNRRNPFMWLYRDRSSPFYSPVGVTENERPVLAEAVTRCFRQAGLQAESAFASGFRYKYVASPIARLALPIYNAIDRALFQLGPLRPYSAFVFTYGKKL